MAAKERHTAHLTARLSLLLVASARIMTLVKYTSTPRSRLGGASRKRIWQYKIKSPGYVRGSPAKTTKI